MKPEVSVIISTYNGGKYISRAIESIISQTFSDWELIILNDGSKDNTKEIVKNYADKDSRIIYIENEKNLGIYKSANKGLKLAKGEYIARIDDDDEWIDKYKLEKQVEFLDKNKDYILVGTRAVCVDEEGNCIRKYKSPVTDKAIRKDILARNPFFHSSVLFKKDVVLKLGGYSEKNKITEDYDLWLRIGQLGKFYVLPIFATKYTIRVNNITSTNLIYSYKRSIELCRKHRKNYDNYLYSLARGYVRLFIYGYILRMPIYVLINKIKRFFKN